MYPKCAYCGAENVPLEVEHIQPKAKGGTNRISNLTLACVPCNLRKGTTDIKDFLKKKPELLNKILSQAKRPLKDAAAVNSTRWKLFEILKSTGLPVEVGSGGRTKFNRTSQGYQKVHWIDAACVGESGENVVIPTSMKPLIAKSSGHGTRQVCNTDKYGFPISHRTATKFFGYKTGDIVKAVVPKGKYAGTHVGRIGVKASGSFKLQTATMTFFTSYKHMKPVHLRDG